MELAPANKDGLGDSANKAPVPMVSMGHNVSASVLVTPIIRKYAIHLTDGAFANLVGKVGIVPALVPSINGDQDVPRHVIVSEMLPVIPSQANAFAQQDTREKNVRSTVRKGHMVMHVSIVAAVSMPHVASLQLENASAKKVGEDCNATKSAKMGSLMPAVKRSATAKITVSAIM